MFFWSFWIFFEEISVFIHSHEKICPTQFVLLNQKNWSVHFIFQKKLFQKNLKHIDRCPYAFKFYIQNCKKNFFFYISHWKYTVFLLQRWNDLWTTSSLIVSFYPYGPWRIDYPTMCFKICVYTLEQLKDFLKESSGTLKHKNSMIENFEEQWSWGYSMVQKSVLWYWTGCYNRPWTTEYPQDHSSSKFSNIEFLCLSVPELSFRKSLSC